MSLDVDDEILQDFLVEATEILELLSEQLVELETRPDDTDLLNAIFRGFHTVKGGAGFLSLTNLVSVCHIGENVFDLLRQGKKDVNPDLMDVILNTLDTVNAMFDEIKSGQDPSPADPLLIKNLEALTVLDGAAPVPQDPIPEETPSETVEDKKTKTAATPAGDDEITEEEFEALLDKLADNKDGDSDVSINDSPKSKEELLQAASKGDSLITDDEFEKLLDSLSDLPQVEVPKEIKEGLPVDESNKDVFAIREDAMTSEKMAAKKEEEKQAQQKSEKVAPKKEESVASSPVVKKEEPADAKKPPTAPKESVAETTVRVDTSRLDEIMNMVGELVLVRNRLVKLKGDSADESMAKAVGNLDVVTADLQMSVMKTRMQPIKKVFGRFPRVVRDLARSLKKEVLLQMEGEDTDLDKNLVEALSDPLVHLVRNSVDHGVEDPDVRAEAGKPRQGTIVLAAEQAGDHIILSITDDGKGMDPDMLRQSAVEKGLMDTDAASRLDDHDAFNLIFMPGFSTKQEISDISGRGVGMDVVKTKISQLNGSIDIDSKKGVGSTIRIKVPLTLAILPTLMVMVGDQTFALPLTSVNEIFNLDLTKTNTVDGQLVIVVREKAIPLFYLQEWLANGFSKEDKGQGHVVIVTIGTQRVGFVVDGLLGQEEVVIKALGDMLQGTAGMAGATITGDGKIAMILDVPTLLERYA